MTKDEAIQMAIDFLDGSYEAHAVRKALQDALAEQEQEPVAWIKDWADGSREIVPANYDNSYPVYTHPAPNKEWVRLSDEDILKFVPSIEEFKPEYGIMLSNEWNILDFAVAIEQALKEKNHD